MGLAVFAIIAIGAFAIGIAAQMVQRQNGFSWLLMAAAMIFGAFFFSETLPTSSLFEGIENWGPQIDGFYLVPGSIGTIVMGVLAYLGTLTPAVPARAS
jgi:hypothetical protein